MPAVSEESHAEGLSGNEENEDFEESLAFLSSNRADYCRDDAFRKKQPDRSASIKWIWWMMAMVFFVLSLSLFYKIQPFIGVASSSSQKASFTCPSHGAQDTPENYDETFVEYYENATQSITENMTEFLANLHEMDFDGWPRKYNDVKASLYDWKAKQYAPYLQDGSTIFESAAGIGLNLYMTLEILYEAKGIKNLRVYGNEYEAVSAKKSKSSI